MLWSVFLGGAPILVVKSADVRRGGDLSLFSKATGRSLEDCLSNDKNERFLDPGYQGRGGYRVFLGNGDNRIVRTVWLVMPPHRQITKRPFL